jgi:cytidine deaminase
MKIKERKIEFIEYEDERELDPADLSLLQKARETADNAHAPYSGFYVGAAVLLEDGTIVPGSNQENIAYPDGLCAERVALFYASSQYPGIAVDTIAITAKADGFHISTPVTPCGSCRQVMAEMENKYSKRMRLILAGETGSVLLIKGIDNLLPLMFHANELKKRLK